MEVEKKRTTRSRMPKFPKAIFVAGVVIVVDQPRLQPNPCRQSFESSCAAFVRAILSNCRRNHADSTRSCLLRLRERIITSSWRLGSFRCFTRFPTGSHTLRADGSGRKVEFFPRLFPCLPVGVQLQRRRNRMADRARLNPVSKAVDEFDRNELYREEEHLTIRDEDDTAITSAFTHNAAISETTNEATLDARRQSSCSLHIDMICIRPDRRIPTGVGLIAADLSAWGHRQNRAVAWSESTGTPKREPVMLGFPSHDGLAENIVPTNDSSGVFRRLRYPTRILTHNQHSDNP